MSNQLETGTALTLPAPTDLANLFRTDGGIDPIIARIEAEVRAHVPDVTTKKGRDAIASLAYRVSRSKTALDDAGKALTEDQKRQIAQVDAARRAVRDRLDALRDEARRPLVEWEAAEESRIAVLKARLDRLSNASPAAETSEEISHLISRVEAAAIDDTWQEYLPLAAKAKDAKLTDRRAHLAAVQTREREQAELAKLRAEAAERAKVEAEAREREREEQAELARKEAAEHAVREAEQRLKAEAERAEREAAEKAAAERASAALREAELQRQVEKARADAEAAAQRERDRIEAERLAEETARKKREADTAHRESIARNIADALRSMSGNATPENIAAALMDGKIPHCVVRL